MKTPPRLDSFLKNKFLHGTAALMTVISAFFTLLVPVLRLSRPYSIFIFIVACLSVAIFAITLAYSLKFRGDIHRLTEQVAKLSAENQRIQDCSIEQLAKLSGEIQRLQDCSKVIHSLNHTYRDVLHEAFGQNRPHDPMTIIEQRTLKAACERIADMFSLLIGVKCVVTVKLIAKEQNGPDKCHTLVRNESVSERDRTLTDYEIDTGKNTAFDTARRYQHNGPSFFFSPDLEKDHKEGKYFNNRPDWMRFYRSAIVVPIRYVNYQSVGSHTALNELGFLAVDTMAIGKLNGTFHMQYMAAFADQMYNFMSLMRGKYCLSPRQA